MISSADLVSYVNGASNDEPFAQTCVDTATSLLGAFVGYGSAEATPETTPSMIQELIGNGTLPASVRDRAILTVAAELFEQRNAPSGIRQFAADGYDGSSAMRVARDPMTGAYPLLRPYLPGGFA